MNLRSSVNKKFDKVTNVPNQYARFGLRWFIRLLAIALVLLLIVFFFTMGYVTANKKKIMSQVTELVKEKIRGDIQIRDVGVTFFETFPYASIKLENVVLTDTQFLRHKHPLLEAKKILLKLNTLRFFKGSLPLKGLQLEDAKIFMYTDSTGYTNQYLLKPKSAETGSKAGNEKKGLGISEIKMQNVQWTLVNEIKYKLHDVFVNRMKIELADRDSGIAFHVQANNDIRSLSFNTRRGSYLKNKKMAGNFNLFYNRVLNKLSFSKAKLNMARHPFELSGAFDLGDQNPQFSLEISTNKILYDEIKSFLTKKVDSALSMVKLDKPVDVKAEIFGPLRGGDPLIKVYGVTKNASMKTPFFDFEDAGFTAYYTNEVVKGIPRKDSNSVIKVVNLSAKWQGLNMFSKELQILNLTEPELSAELTSSFPLTEINKFTNTLDFTEGNANVSLRYKGPVVRSEITNSLISGHIFFTDGKLNYSPRNIILSSVNGKLLFNNASVDIENISASVFGQSVRMFGSAKNVLTLVNTQPNEVAIDWNIQANRLDMQPFTALLKKRGLIKQQKRQSQTLDEIAYKIDRILDEGRLDVELNVGNLIYKKFNGANVNANVTILQNRYLLNNVSFNEGGGRMEMSGSMVGNNIGHNVSLKVNASNVDVGNLFAAFENFGQSAILNSNIDGKLNANVDASMLVLESGKVSPGSMNGLVDFSLVNGSLKNFEPFKKMQSFVFNDRDFSNVKFAELKNKFIIRNGDINIPRMEISSNVLQLFVEGLYSSKGNTDLSIQIPVSNLSKKDNRRPTNSGVNSKVGSSIYLRGRTKVDGTIGFKLDLFNKFNREKEEPEITAQKKAAAEERKEKRKERRAKRAERQAVDTHR